MYIFDYDTLLPRGVLMLACMSNYFSQCTSNTSCSKCITVMNQQYSVVITLALALSALQS